MSGGCSISRGFHSLHSFYFGDPGLSIVVPSVGHHGDLQPLITRTRKYPKVCQKNVVHGFVMSGTEEDGMSST